MSAWKDHVTAALLGTGKASPPPLPPSLQAALEGAPEGDAETRFLTQAGAFALWRRAGWTPAASDASIEPGEPEATQPVSQTSAGHLSLMLNGRYAAVLPEWLGEAARQGRHVPPECVPALLERARKDRSLIPLVMPAGGKRAQWLAKRNPDWAGGEVESGELWETGNREQRLTFLRRLRQTAPAEARARLEAAWEAEPAETRRAFIAALVENLSREDEPFLEKLLSDRSKEVRRAAVDLLARLPGSAFVGRMTERARAALELEPARLLSRVSLKVTLPGEPDAAAIRDGLEPKAFGQQKQLGEKAVLLVLILSAVPLSLWTETFQQSPDSLLNMADAGEFGRALATGWAWAALRQRDVAWAEALLESSLQPHTEFLPPQSLLTILPEPARVERLTLALRSGMLQRPEPEIWRSLVEEILALSGYLPLPLARDVLAALRQEAAGGIRWEMRGAAEALLLRLPPSLLSEAAGDWPLDQEGVAPLAELISFRHDVLTALTRS